MGFVPQGYAALPSFPLCPHYRESALRPQGRLEGQKRYGPEILREAVMYIVDLACHRGRAGLAGHES